MEDFDILQSENTKKQETYVRNSYSNEWDLCSKRTYVDSVIVSNELFDEKGELEFINTYQLSENTITAKLEDSTIEWNFNNDGWLEMEIRSFKYDGNSSWNFRMDTKSNLTGINKYKIERLNNNTIRVYNSEYARYEIKEIIFNKVEGVIQTTDYENLKSTIYLDTNKRVIRRIDKYGNETITDYESKYSYKTYSKDKDGRLNLIFEYNELIEENRITKYRKSYGNTVRDAKEITYVK